MNNHGFGKLVTFLNQLEQERISYTLAHHRDETMHLLLPILFTKSSLPILLKLENFLLANYAPQQQG